MDKELKRKIAEVDAKGEEAIARLDAIFNSLEELIELLKKVMPIAYMTRELFWEQGHWRVYLGRKVIYRGDSLIEALRILTKEE